MSPVSDLHNPEKTTSWETKKEVARRQATPGQVATKLERLRRDNEYTPKEAAEAAGIPVSRLYKLERGRWLPLSSRDPNRRQKYGRAIAGLAVAYGVKVEDILLITDAENNRVLGGRT